MTIRVLKKLEYQSRPIYIRQFGTIFEYIIISKDNLYSSYFDIKPQWFRTFFANPYTQKQIDNSVNLTIAAAHRTIEMLEKEGK